MRLRGILAKVLLGALCRLPVQPSPTRFGFSSRQTLRCVPLVSRFVSGFPFGRGSTLPVLPSVTTFPASSPSMNSILICAGPMRKNCFRVPRRLLLRASIQAVCPFVMYAVAYDKRAEGYQLAGSPKASETSSLARSKSRSWQRARSISASRIQTLQPARVRSSIFLRCTSRAAGSACDLALTFRTILVILASR